MSKAPTKADLQDDLEACTRHLRVVADSMPQMVFIKGSDLRYAFVNGQYADSLGAESGAMVGCDDYEFYPRELADKYRADDRQVISSGEPVDIEEPYLHQGQEGWVHTLKKPVLNDDGQVEGVLGVFWDVTDRKRTEHNLAERTKELQCLIALSDLVDRVGDDWDLVAQGTVDLIPPGWQFPEITAARLSVQGQVFTSQGFRETEWMLSEDLTTDDGPLGRLDVAYLEERPTADDGPFLSAEKALLRALSERLAHIHGRITAFTELRQHREHLEEQVSARTRALEESNHRLQAEMAERQRRDEIIGRQTEEIMELSTPVLRVAPGVVLSVLIGNLDSQRTSRFLEVLLESVAEAHAEVALVDITGVPTVDTQTAQHITEAVAAVGLLGARVILTGIRPSIAQTLVHLGIDLSTLDTCASLAAGLRMAMDPAHDTEGANT